MNEVIDTDALLVGLASDLFQIEMQRMAESEENLARFLELASLVHDRLDFALAYPVELDTDNFILRDLPSITVYILSLEQTLINWLRQQETREIVDTDWKAERYNDSLNADWSPK